MTVRNIKHRPIKAKRRQENLAKRREIYSQKSGITDSGRRDALQRELEAFIRRV